MVSVAREEVNLRSGPGTRYSAEWVLSRGFPLKVVGRRGDWLHVRTSDGVEGWVTGVVARPMPTSTATN